MAYRFIVFQHSPLDCVGKLLSNFATKKNIQLDIIEIWHQPIPPLTPYDGLIVLDGSPNINQENHYPFLRSEKKAIRDSINEDRPYLGFCLGHQLLADALGARINNNYRASLGVIRGYLTHHGRHHQIFAGFDKTMPLFKWHTQTICEPLPRNLRILTTSADCQVEAISVKDRPHLIGLQFDNHVADPRDVAARIAKDDRWLTSLDNTAADPNSILTSVERYQKTLRNDFNRLITNFLTCI